MVHEVADHRDVIGADFPASLCGRGCRQLRFETLAGHGPTLPEPGGLGDPPAGIRSADSQPLRQHRPPRFGPHILRCRLGLQVRDQRVLESGLAAPVDFQPVQHRQCLPGAKCVDLQRGQLVPQRLKVVQRGQDLHVSNTSSIP